MREQLLSLSHNSGQSVLEFWDPHHIRNKKNSAPESLDSAVEHIDMTAITCWHAPTAEKLERPCVWVGTDDVIQFKTFVCVCIDGESQQVLNGASAARIYTLQAVGNCSCFEVTQ